MKSSAQWTKFFEVAYRDLGANGVCEINRRRNDFQDDVMEARDRGVPRDKAWEVYYERPLERLVAEVRSKHNLSVNRNPVTCNYKGEHDMNATSQRQLAAVGTNSAPVCGHAKQLESTEHLLLAQMARADRAEARVRELEAQFSAASRRRAQDVPEPPDLVASIQAARNTTVPFPAAPATRRAVGEAAPEPPSLVEAIREGRSKPGGAR